MYMDEGNKKLSKRSANRPNFHKGSRARIPSQTIGDAKIQINSEIAIPKLKELSNKYKNIDDPRGFLTDLRNALGIPDSNGASKYGVVTIPKQDGTTLEVSLRITNHQANANTYIEHNANYEYNISIVVKKNRRKNTFIPNDNVRLDEFVYYGYNLQKVENPLSKISEGLIEYLTTGKYEDKTGVALQNTSPKITENKQNNTMNNKKNLIRLTESQLYRIIKNCVKNVLNENKFDGNHKGEAYDINSKKYKHMFDKGNIDPYDYTDYDYLDGENAAKEFLNRPNAAQDFQHFPRFSVRKGVKEYDDLANGTTRIRQYKKNAWKYKQPGTEEHFLTWWKNKENTLSTNPYEDFYSVPRSLQLMYIGIYAHQYNLLRNQVAMTVMPFDPEEDDYFGDKYNEENW